MKNKVVFLGGTCNNSTWRDELIPKLNIGYFNPVVPDWNEEAYQKELEWRQKSDYVLYTITPEMTGVYSIAEVVDDSNKRPEKSLFCILENGLEYSFSEFQMRSLNAVKKMVEKNGAKVFSSLDEVAEYLNQ